MTPPAQTISHPSAGQALEQAEPVESEQLIRVLGELIYKAEEA